MKDEFGEMSDRFSKSMGFITNKDLENILSRHIEEGHDPYTDDEVKKILRWIDETSLSMMILEMVLEGEVDILFDREKLKDFGYFGNNALLFSLTKKKASEIDKIDKLLNNKSILENFNFFSGETKQ